MNSKELKVQRCSSAYNYINPENSADLLATPVTRFTSISYTNVEQMDVISTWNRIIILQPVI